MRPLMEKEYSKKDYPITTIFENKRFSSFFFLQTDQWNSRFNYATIENSKTVRTYLNSQETSLKFMNVLVQE